MNYFIHGDFHAGSRKFLSSFLENSKDKDIFKVNGEKADLTEIIQATASDSLFGGDKLVVIENLFSRLKSKTQEDILEFIKDYDGENQIIFWEKKSIGKVLQRRLPKDTHVKEFKTPAVIFKFVENVSPKNKKMALTLFTQVLESQSAQFVFAMLIRQMRMMIMIAGGEKVAGAPWMIGKIKKQAEEFGLPSLLTNYEKLYIIDKQIKTGQTLMDYEFHLTTWLASL